MPKGPRSPRPAGGGFSFRWGIPVLDNLPFTLLYHFLLDHYAALGMDPLEMMFIIHLSQYRHETPDGRAMPSLATIAELMGYQGDQQVRRIKRALLAKGLLRVTPQPGYTDIYDVAPFAAAAFNLWQSSQQAITTPIGSDTPIILDTPIGSNRGIPTDSSTPVGSDRGEVSHAIGEKENKENIKTNDDSNQRAPQNTQRNSSTPVTRSASAMAPVAQHDPSRRYSGPHSAYLAGVVQDHSSELGDAAHWAANVTRAHRLWQASGLGEEAFVALLHTARQRVRTYQGKQGSGTIANKMAYYFRCLADLAGVPTELGAGW